MLDIFSDFTSNFEMENNEYYYDDLIVDDDLMVEDNNLEYSFGQSQNPSLQNSTLQNLPLQSQPQVHNQLSQSQLPPNQLPLENQPINDQHDQQYYYYQQNQSLIQPQAHNQQQIGHNQQPMQNQQLINHNQLLMEQHQQHMGQQFPNPYSNYEYNEYDYYESSSSQLSNLSSQNLSNQQLSVPAPPSGQYGSQNIYFDDKHFTPYYLNSANVDLSNYSTPNVSNSQYSPNFEERRQSTQSLQQSVNSNSVPLSLNIPLIPPNNNHSNSSNNSNNNLNNIHSISPNNSPQSPISKRKDENKIITSNNSNFRVVRGVAAGGSSARPPKESHNSKSTYLPVQLMINGGKLKDIVKPTWSSSELEDQRRIIRIERFQKNEQIFINFSIVGSAAENPTPLPPASNSNIDIIEVSCLQCSKKLSEEIDLPSPINEDQTNNSGNNDEVDDDADNDDSNYLYDYYITSVEVIEIVELLIGTFSEEPSERRKERGRVRSNLVPFWSKKPISSKLDNSLSNQPDFKIELAKRIMKYEIRRPRGFDKEVRILKWEKLLPALKRALQSYYCEIPPII